jgi:hypothetical protein
VSAVTTLGPEVRDLLRKRFGFAPPSVFRLPHPTALPDHPPLDAANWHCLHVIHSDGRPAANTRVWLGDSSTTGGKILRTDRAGRLLFEAHRTVRAVVYAAAGYGTIDVPANVTEARLPLRSVRVTAGRTIDADGKPVAGQTVLMYLAGIPDATDELRICAQNVGWRRARSDAEGRFEMVLPPFVARIGLTTDLYRLTPRIDLDWDPEKPPELVLTVPGR